MSAADEQWSVALIQALAALWTKIRTLHAGVPGVVLIPAPAHRDQKNVLGHFAPVRWRRRDDEHLHEVVVVAEHLNRPAEDVLETLIHEAAHALNFERGIRDCSRSQYHNRSFKSAAEELDLIVEQVPHYGFAKTSLGPATADRYAAEVEQLRTVLIHRRGITLRPTPPGGTPPADDDGDTSSRSRKAVCACEPPFIIRVAKKTIEATTILCSTCGQAFRLN